MCIFSADRERYGKKKENLLSAHRVYGKSVARNQLEIDNNQNHGKYWLLYEKLIFRLHSFHIM